MARTPYVDRNGLKKGTWTSDEDFRLASYISAHGCRNWRQLPKAAGLARCGKSCRLRWLNYLRPDIKRGSFTQLEQATIRALHQNLGNKWSLIAAHMPGRTDNEIKNYWNTHLRKMQHNQETSPILESPNPAVSTNSTDSESVVNIPISDDKSDQNSHEMMTIVDHQQEDHDYSLQMSAGSSSHSSSAKAILDSNLTSMTADYGDDVDFWSRPFWAHGEGDDDQYSSSRQQSEVYYSATDEFQFEGDMLWLYYAMNYS